MSRSVSARSGPLYDVFISYRRAGGADFAHLIKLQLKAVGLECFLDVENIGMGSFADVLDSSMQSSRNIVLVWSKGCFDRFIDDADPTNGDFVRREYALALRLGKNIVPVVSDMRDPALSISPPHMYLAHCMLLTLCSHHPHCVAPHCSTRRILSSRLPSGYQLTLRESCARTRFRSSLRTGRLALRSSRPL